jgi:hypothetical protein
MNLRPTARETIKAARRILLTVEVRDSQPSRLFAYRHGDVLLHQFLPATCRAN